MAATSPITAQPDSPEAQRYNRIKRWLGIADFAVGFGLLIVLLLTGWTNNLRDTALDIGRQYYTVALISYVVMLMLLTKVIGIGLEYYGYRVERNYHLSNQKLPGWLWDQVKGFLVSVILATIVAVVLYSILRAVRRTLVVDFLGGFSRNVRPDGANRARCAVSYFLQI